jgi:hypothetical protein
LKKRIYKRQSPRKSGFHRGLKKIIVYSMIKPLPRDITTNDLLKTAALLFMFTDHAGFYFYPDEVWFRVIGRFSAPFWFFLIGYADTRTVQRGIWIGAVLVALTWIVSGQYIFPLNILFALAFGRLMLDGLMLRALKDKQSLWGIYTMLFFLSFPSVAAFEYGTLGIMFVVAGFLVRHRIELNIPRKVVAGALAISGLSIAGVQIFLMPPMTGEQYLVLFGGMALVCATLYFFKAKTLPLLTKALGPLSHIVKFTGRRTLEIYVVHLMIIAAVVMTLYPERFGFLEFKVAPPAIMQLFR